MGIFYLKENDLFPVLEVVLKNPDETIHDPTGETPITLHIWLSDGTKLAARTMTIFDGPTGVVRYQWVSTDWDTGNLVVTPSLPLSPGVREHRLEYQTISGGLPLTFPNDGYDTLRILEEANP